MGYLSILYHETIVPYSKQVSTPVSVANNPIPAPLALIFSTRVPWGTNSTSISPLKNYFSVNLLVIKDMMNLDIYYYEAK